MAVKTWDEYIKDATDRTTPGYDAQLKEADSGYNSNLTQYNNQVGDINLKYDNQVADVGRNTTQTQNQYNANVMSRGMGRSSVADTGLAGIANTGTRLTKETNQYRTNDLNNVEALKTTLLQNYNNQKSALESKKQGDILSMADQLQKYDQEKDAAEKEAQRQAAARAQSLAIQRQQLAAQLKQAEINRQIEEANWQNEQSEKDFNMYLGLGQKMMDKLIDDPNDPTSGKVKAYDDDYMYNWIGNTNLDSTAKYRLQQALSVQRPIWLSTNPYYNGVTKRNNYIGGR